MIYTVARGAGIFCMVETKFSQYGNVKNSAAGASEADLISDAVQGDLEAFNQLVLCYQDQIFSLANWIMGDECAAEDITQDAFLSAYRSLRQFHHGSFRSWLYRIATNACYDELRRRKRRPIQSIEGEDETDEMFLLPDDLQASQTLPEKAYDRKELERTIQQALHQLDENQRTVVVLIDLQGFDYQEAAKALGVPVGTVKSRVARARMQLRLLLQTV
jgi:RNA polymerase sigma factor (sigma-70 family)